METEEKKTAYANRTFRLTKQLLDDLSAYSKATGISKTFIVENSIRQYLDKVKDGTISH